MHRLKLLCLKCGLVIVTVYDLTQELEFRRLVHGVIRGSSEEFDFRWNEKRVQENLELRKFTSVSLIEQEHEILGIVTEST